MTSKGSGTGRVSAASRAAKLSRGFAAFLSSFMWHAFKVATALS